MGAASGRPSRVCEWGGGPTNAARGGVGAWVLRSQGFDFLFKWGKGKRT